MKELKTTITKVAAVQSTVLITGESGTGKELVARAIHQGSSRSEQPFVALNCGAIPEALLESELFGHVKGAFTDAHRDKAGLIVEANGGALFLDEIGELPASLQVSLLRVVQEGEVRPVGSTHTKMVNVRFIAATHRNLEEAVKAGRFREDLFYRLNVVPIAVPPLRARASDIPLLADHILARLVKQMNRPAARLHPDTLNALLQYPWPGNVRELENILERGLVLSNTSVLTPDSLPREVAEGHNPVQTTLSSQDLSIKRASRYVEQELIRKALDKHQGNRTHAAKELEISHRALLYKIKEYGLT